MTQQNNFGFKGCTPLIWVPETVEQSDEKSRPLKVSLCFTRLGKEQAQNVTEQIAELKRDVTRAALELGRWESLRNNLYLGEKMPESVYLFAKDYGDKEELSLSKDNINSVLSTEICDNEMQKLVDLSKEASQKLTDLLVQNLKDWKIPGENGNVEFSEEARDYILDFEPYFEAFMSGLQKSSGKKLREDRQKN